MNKLPGTVLCLLISTLRLSAGTYDKPPFLAGIFSDNMVLQRGMADPIWGWTTPGAAVTVSVVGSRLSAKVIAGADGKWLAKLPAPPVGGPYTIKIDGPQSVTLNNVMSGDVWLCAGQSNMVFPLSDVSNNAVEIAAADYPQIRLSEGGKWLPCTTDNENRKHFSAVGYYFGRRLNGELKIPIGLIQRAAGGTMVESWTGERALRKYMPELNATLDANIRERAGEDIFAQWFAANDPGSANNSWASPTFDDSKWEQRLMPSQFDDILVKFAGALWFRSEFDLADAGGG